MYPRTHLLITIALSLVIGHTLKAQTDAGQFRQSILNSSLGGYSLFAGNTLAGPANTQTMGLVGGPNLQMDTKNRQIAPVNQILKDMPTLESLLLASKGLQGNAQRITSNQALSSGIYKLSQTDLATDIRINGDAETKVVFIIDGDLTLPQAFTLYYPNIPDDNIIWVVQGNFTVNTKSDFGGIVLCKGNIIYNGASSYASLFAQGNIQLNTPGGAWAAPRELRGIGRRCASDALRTFLKLDTPEPNHEKDMNPFGLKQLHPKLPDSLTTNAFKIGGDIIVPVVFHFIKDPSAANGGVEFNTINAACVQAQLDALNDYFNDDPAITPNLVQGGDHNIRFCLAQQKLVYNYATQQYDINPINSSTRFNAVSTTGLIDTSGSFNNIYNVNLGNINNISQIQSLALSPQKYLNIFVVKSISAPGFNGGVIGGVATLPGGSVWDGIIIRYDVLGSLLHNPASGGPIANNPAVPSWNKGVVLAHEVGHYLNLYHTFQGGCTEANCQYEGDNVCDTPPANTLWGCPTANTCSNDVPDLIDDHANIMAYTNDNCGAKRFSAGQGNRMAQTLDGLRANLASIENIFEVFTAPCGLTLPPEVLLSVVDLPNQNMQLCRWGSQNADTSNSDVKYKAQFPTVAGSISKYEWDFGPHAQCLNCLPVNGWTQNGQIWIHTNPPGNISIPQIRFNVAGIYETGVKGFMGAATYLKTSDIKAYVIDCDSITQRKEHANWVFGEQSQYFPHLSTAFNFSRGYAKNVTANPNAHNMYRNFSYSDSNGKLLFYSGCFYGFIDSIKFYDGNHQIINGGIQDSILYNSPTAFSKPGSTTKHILMASSMDNGLVYVEYDATTNSFGTQTFHNIPMGSYVSAIRHANGIDWWIICHKRNSDKLCSYLFTSSGLATNPSFEISSFSITDNLIYPPYYPFYFGGEIQHNIKGDKFAIYAQYLSNGIGSSGFLNIYSFNASIGSISLLYSKNLLSHWQYHGGLVFSPNGKYLYYNDYNFPHPAPYLAQLNLINVYCNHAEINKFFSKSRYGILQLAPDNRLYSPGGYYAISPYQTLNVHYAVINKPDNKLITGQNTIEFNEYGPKQVRIDIYSMPNLTFATQTCIEKDFGFCASCPAAKFFNLACGGTWLWDFGDGTPTSNLENPTHTYSTPGTYTVKLYTDGAANPTVSKPITIALPPLPVVIGNFAPACNIGYEYTIANGDTNQYIYNWTVVRGSQTLTFNRLQSITIAWAAANTTRSISVTAIDKYTGCVRTMPAVQLINPCNSNPPIANFTKQSTPCGFAVQFTSTATNVPANAIYLWSFGDGTTASTANATHTYTQAGNYTVTLLVKAPTGSPALFGQMTQTVVITSLPIALITPVGNVLHAQVVPGATYQWLYNGQPISGATDSIYVPSVNGVYEVQVTLNGCTVTSPGIISNSIKQNIAAENQLKIYPNPSHDLLNIEAPLAIQKLEVLNVLGQVVYTRQLSGGTRDTQIPVSQLSQGLYLLRCFGDNHHVLIRHFRKE